MKYQILLSLNNRKKFKTVICCSRDGVLRVNMNFSSRSKFFNLRVDVFLELFASIFKGNKQKIKISYSAVALEG